MHTLDIKKMGNPKIRKFSEISKFIFDLSNLSWKFLSIIKLRKYGNSSEKGIADLRKYGKNTQQRNVEIAKIL